MALVTLAGMIAVIFGAWLIATRPSQYRHSLLIGVVLLVVGVGLSLLVYSSQLGLAPPMISPIASKVVATAR